MTGTTKPKLPGHSSVMPPTLQSLENLTALDPTVRVAESVVNRVVRPARLRDLLHGVWLGHPVHPVLVQVPVGAWTSAAVLDALPGTGTAPDTLLAVGLCGVLPALATGWTDWSTLHEQQKRVGLVHAASNVAATSLYLASLVSRRTGHRTTGKVLGWAGFATAGLGSYVGGHLAYRQAAGVNHAEFVPHLLKPGWHSIGPFEELPQGKPVTRRLGDVNLMVLRRGNDVNVLANRCSHLDGPLAEGSIDVSAGEDCVSCPWHGSTFRLSDGKVLHGPATAPQPVFETRVVEGKLQVLLEGAG
jgi:nitrite reductase/ring-hydroxylating ferredoxin subunit